MLGRGREDGEGHAGAGLAGALLAPFVALLVQMGISRAREFLADAGAASITGDPAGLASALRRLEAYARKVPMETGAPATAHLFIVNPLSAEGLAGLVSTHPPLKERVRRLERLERHGIPVSVI
jgi:heat shock protein HtpX